MEGSGSVKKSQNRLNGRLLKSVGNEKPRDNEVGGGGRKGKEGGCKSRSGLGTNFTKVGKKP